MGTRLAEKVLLIGWDAADWQVIDRLIEEGKMPALASLIDGGVMGNLSTLRPMLSPMLWNSICTGKRADKHGIHGFIEPNPDNTGIRAVSSTSRKTKAVWNILSQSGLRCHVVGWYASHPAEPINGVCVSERFPHMREDADELPAVPTQSVHPPEMAEALAELRVRPKQIGPYHLAPFVPTLGQIPPDETPPITGMQKMLAKCATIHAVATELVEHHPWDFAAVYFETIDHFCHAFMKYHPPRMDHIDATKFERYKGCVEGIYRFHDMMLERMLQLAGDDATVMIVSDHGFLNDHLRPVERDGMVAGPEAWHRAHGVFVLKGPHVRKDERVYGASILDVTPTVLTLFGLPIGADMDGKALVQSFESAEAVEVERVESWDAQSGPHDPGAHPPEMQVDPFEEQAALQQLVELGYVAAPDENAEKAMKVARTEAQFNLAASHIDAAQYGKAAALLEALHAQSPDEPRFRGLLAEAYFQLGRLADVRRLLGVVADAPNRTAQMNLLLGTLEFAEGNTDAALRYFREAEQAKLRLPSVHIRLGEVYLKQRHWEDAERAFRLALEIDPENAMASYGLGDAVLHLGRAEEAVEHTLRAVGLMHYFPRAHYQLGVALVKLGWLERAAQAFKTAVGLRPGFVRAHRYLTAVYLKLGDAERARVHAEIVGGLTQAASARREREAAAARSDPAA
jgi:predicted AlkP superfamily phosphohydrolase/phosphomutase/tetratricopeptide (TPR) repeat protein